MFIFYVPLPVNHEEIIHHFLSIIFEIVSKYQARVVMKDNISMRNASSMKDKFTFSERSVDDC